jgi:hypothetical protein
MDRAKIELKPGGSDPAVWIASATLPRAVIMISVYAPGRGRGRIEADLKRFDWSCLDQSERIGRPMVQTYLDRALVYQGEALTVRHCKATIDSWYPSGKGAKRDRRCRSERGERCALKGAGPVAGVDVEL